jgi:hypothetical protein
LGAQLPDALAPDEGHRWESPGSWLDHFRIADDSIGVNCRVFEANEQEFSAANAILLGHSHE